jgi:hypothetical protein
MSWDMGTSLHHHPLVRVARLVVLFALAFELRLAWTHPSQGLAVAAAATLLAGAALLVVSDQGRRPQLLPAALPSRRDERAA